MHVAVHSVLYMKESMEVNCKVRADKPQVVGSGQINRSDHGGIGIIHQVLVLACESRTPISEARLEVWVKRRCLNKVGMD